jgi:hypothetical protein
MGMAGQAADLMAFLADPRSAFILRAIMTVDGGIAA